VVLPDAARHVHRRGRARGVRRLPDADEGMAAPRAYIFLCGVALLALVFIPGVGKSVNGSRRWISLAVVNIQPSEFMKLAVVLYAASYAVRKAAFLHAEQPLRQTIVKGFLPLFLVMVFTSALILLEPDFGAFAVIVVIAFGILYLAGSIGASSSDCCCCFRSASRRFSSPRLIGCSGSSRFSIRGPIRSARATSSRTR
jgi:hypothetical protein